MKTMFSLLFLLASTAAFAAPPVNPPKHLCGETLDDCEKAYDGLLEQVADWTAAYNAIRNQRDSAQQQINDGNVKETVRAAQEARKAAKK